MSKKNKKTKLTKKKNNTQVDKGLLNNITPIGIDFGLSTTRIGENNGKILGITSYPLNPTTGWLNNITNIPNTVVSMKIKPVESYEFLKVLERNIRNEKANMESNEELEKIRAKKTYDDSIQLMTNIDQNNEQVVEFNTNIFAYTQSENENIVKKSTKNVASKINVLGGKSRYLAGLQKAGFKMINPAFVGDKDIEQITSTTMPLSSIIGGFPYSTSGINDKTGIYLGIDDNTKKPVIADLWLRNNERFNSNMVVVGKSGSGKSSTLKELTFAEYIRGTKIVIIDFEGEYRKLAKVVKGDIINAGGSEYGRINPLQIRPYKAEEDISVQGEQYDRGLSDYAVYMNTLETFFGLYLDNMTVDMFNVLKDCIIKTYSKFNIDEYTDVTKLANEDFPIISDLYEVIKEEYELNIENANYKSLLDGLKDMHEMTHKYIWNGHTTLKSESNFTVIDASALRNMTERVRKSQYYNIMQWAWQELTRNKNERVLLLCDEAHLMIDEDVPQTVKFLNEVVRRVRKYNGGLILATQTIQEFNKHRIKAESKALLSQSSIKIMFNTDATELEDVSEVYHLNEKETELLAKGTMGKGLLFIGNKRISVKFKLTHKDRWEDSKKEKQVV